MGMFDAQTPGVSPYGLAQKYVVFRYGTENQPLSRSGNIKLIHTSRQSSIEERYMKVDKLERVAIRGVECTVYSNLVIHCCAHCVKLVCLKNTFIRLLDLDRVSAESLALHIIYLHRHMSC